MNKARIAFIMMGATIIILSGVIIYLIFFPKPEFLRSFDPDRPPRFSDTDRMISRMKKELSLTDQQCEDIRKIHSGEQSKMQEREKEISREMKLMSDLINSDTFREKEIRASIQRIDRIKQDMKLDFIRMRFEDEKVLNEVQKNHLRQILKEKMGKLKHRFE